MAPKGSAFGEERFRATIHTLPSNLPHICNLAVDVPRRVSRAFGRRGHVPVTGTVDGAPLTATLVPAGGGRHRLFLDGKVRRAIGKGAGDRVEVRIRFDPADRMPRLPRDLREALRDAGAWDDWRTLPPSRRKEYLTVLADAKRPATRRRRLRRIVEAARAERPSRRPR